MKRSVTVMAGAVLTVGLGLGLGAAAAEAAPPSTPACTQVRPYEIRVIKYTDWFQRTRAQKEQWLKAHPGDTRAQYYYRRWLDKHAHGVDASHNRLNLMKDACRRSH
jgi:hypothetical protein